MIASGSMSIDLLEEPTAELLGEIDEVIHRNLMLDAYALSQKVALPLSQWPHGAARRVAAHLCDSLGDSRRGHLLDWLNWRADRDHDRYYFLALFSRLAFKSPYELIPEVETRLSEKQGRMLATDECNLLSFLGWCYATLHDFDRAHSCLQRGMEIDAHSSWLHAQLSIVLEQQDRYEDSLQAALRAVELRPTYRPAVAQLAHIYMLLGRDQDAMDLLREVHQKTQNACFVLQLQGFYSERDWHEESVRCLDDAEALLPLINDSRKEWFAGRRSDFAYLAGDFDGFRQYAAKVKSGYHQKILERFERSDSCMPYRVKLEVPFIRQHNMTCAPATLASLSRYWGKEADHLAIADAICYDGTPWHKERGWAESQGFKTREFRVTREILFSLIDREIPFTLTTESITSAHLQACIGYDRRLDVILLRDPTHRHYGEMLLTGLFDEHPLGPRGMVMVPEGKEHLLDGLHFPDAAAFDALHELSVALERNDRLQADAALALMRAVAGDQPLLWDAQYRYYHAFGNLLGQSTALELLRQAFPSHHTFSLFQMTLLGRMHRPLEQRTLAETMVALPDHAAVFDSEYGEILLDDARDLPRAERMLLRAMRRQRSQGHVYESLARCREKQRCFEEVVRLRKVASCLSPSSEFYAQAYFESCRAVAKTEESLVYLQRRVEELGNKNAGPWLTLVQAYQSLGRQQDAKEVMEQALQRLPDDSALLCRSGSMMLRWGESHREAGMAMIRKARDRMPEYQWFQEMAFAHVFLGNRSSAIQYWENLIKVQPMSITGYRNLASLIADEHGVDAALTFLSDACAKQKSLIGLWVILAEWQGFQQDPQTKTTLDHILSLDPDYAWALRERSEVLSRQGDHEAALKDAREALEKAPYQPESHGVLAHALREVGREEEANEALRSALKVDVDYTWAASMLVFKAQGIEEQLRALDFIYEQMMAQVSRGDIVTEYQSLAYPLLEPEVLLKQLREFCALRPDLWQTWTARKLQCQSMDLAAEAMDCAITMTESFPLLPRAWSELADVHHGEGRYVEECVALQKALDLTPAWDAVARRLADAMERLQQYREAEQVLLGVIDVEPLASQNYLALAALWERSMRSKEALALMQKCVRQIPMARSAWERYATLAQKCSAEQQVLDELREYSAKYEHRAQWWLVAAETCSQLEEGDLAIEYCRRGLALQPKLEDLRDLLVCHLTYKQQFEEAKAVCLERIGHEPLGREREGRYCWVLLNSGKAVEAIERMEQLLLKEPDYSWLMSLLASCRSQRSQWTELKDLAQKWVRMDPRNELAYGYLGNAWLKLSDKTRAMRAFQQAVSIEPAYHFACRQLFDLQLEAKQFDDARQTLVHLQHYLPGAATVCDEMDVLIAEKQFAQAMNLIPQLLEQDDVIPGQLQWFQERMRSSGQQAMFEKWLQSYMAEAKPMHLVPVIVWIDFMVRRNQQAKCAKQLERLPLADEDRVAAWVGLIEATDQADQISLLEGWVNRHRSFFMEHAKLWNAVGYSYTNMLQYARALAWLKEWDTREDANDVTYNNVSLALDAISGVQSGDAPRRKLWQRHPNSRLLPAMLPKLALCALVDGRCDEANEHMSNVERTQLPETALMVACLVDSMLDCERDLERARKQYGEAIDRLTKFPTEVISRSCVTVAESYVLSRVPLFRGKITRLRKGWYASKAHPLGSGASRWARLAWVVAAILAYLIFYYVISGWAQDL